MRKFFVAAAPRPAAKFRARLIVYTSAEAAQDLPRREIFRRMERAEDRIVRRNAFFS
jgi:ribosomal protein S18 acetylase RimI-like enzyme